MAEYRYEVSHLADFAKEGEQQGVLEHVKIATGLAIAERLEAINTTLEKIWDLKRNGMGA